MTTNNSWNSNIPVQISLGGTNATSMSTSNGIVKYDGTRLVTSSTATIDASNRQVNTAQPAFFAYLGTSDNNATGNGATYTLGAGNALTVSIDQGSNFNSNGTFTAPVTGLYTFAMALCISNISTGNSGQLNLIAGGVTYRIYSYSPSSSLNVATGQFCMNGSITIPLSASNTAIVQGIVSNESGNTNTIVGGSTRSSYFCGYLCC